MDLYRPSISEIQLNNRPMKRYTSIFILMLFIAEAGCSQEKKTTTRGTAHIGGGCEGCEAVLEYGKKTLNNVDTLPDFHEQGPRLMISGTVYQSDGKTPAKDVILYVYHTDQTGRYTPLEGDTGAKRRHGYIRGWIKTDATGKYKLYTLRPASYPGTKAPAHIHPVIKEPGKNEYWIDEFLFDDDPFVTSEVRASQQKRGGNGILNITKLEDGTQIAERDIVLGKNVPDYY
jgi:protocatechuate 3,4-dioxygenase, beta subunit